MADHTLTNQAARLIPVPPELSGTASAGERRLDRFVLDLCAQHAVRAMGHVEPNPLVGAALLVREGRPGHGRPLAGEVRGVLVGHHRRFGDLHAEVDVLRRAAALGVVARGMTLYATLEPCDHTGKQPPCTRAIIEAGIREVVCARRDPNPLARGGAETLARAGIGVRFTDASGAATALAEPFVWRLGSDLPWVIAKWASTIDGKLATYTGNSQWISGATSRAHTHRLRGVVDAIITGVGTVLADDPELTARETMQRRRALRVIVDPSLRIFSRPELKLLRPLAAGMPGVLVACTPNAAITGEAQGLRDRGIAVVAVRNSGPGDRLDLRALLSLLRSDHGCNTVMIEAGPRLLGAFIQSDLVNELVHFTGPLVVGDGLAGGIAGGVPIGALASASRWTLSMHRRSGEDLLAVYRRAGPKASGGPQASPAPTLG